MKTLDWSYAEKKATFIAGYAHKLINIYHSEGFAGRATEVVAPDGSICYRVFDYYPEYEESIRDMFDVAFIKEVTFSNPLD